MRALRRGRCAAPVAVAAWLALAGACGGDEETAGDRANAPAAVTSATATAPEPEPRRGAPASSARRSPGRSATTSASSRDAARRVGAADGGARPASAAATRGTLTAFVRRATALRARPGGRRVATLPRRTRFGSPQVLAVVSRRGRWLGVLASELRNGQVGWIDGRGIELFRTAWSIDADLSRRRVVVRRDGRVAVRVRVAVGRPSSPTPRGRFAVTDRIRTGRDGGPYGCCVLALTGHQPRVPQGWGGGDRLAIHATPAEQTIGQAASLGCLRATNAVMRRLIRLVPLGTRVTIRG
jgi:lipoprotein-anchoring transpeptidase ErfK/SrfK